MPAFIELDVRASKERWAMIEQMGLALKRWLEFGCGATAGHPVRLSVWDGSDPDLLAELEAWLEWNDIESWSKNNPVVHVQEPRNDAAGTRRRSEPPRGWWHVVIWPETSDLMLAVDKNIANYLLLMRTLKSHDLGSIWTGEADEASLWELAHAIVNRAGKWRDNRDALQKFMREACTEALQETFDSRQTAEALSVYVLASKVLLVTLPNGSQVSLAEKLNIDVSSTDRTYHLALLGRIHAAGKGGKIEISSHILSSEEHGPISNVVVNRLKSSKDKGADEYLRETGGARYRGALYRVLRDLASLTANGVSAWSRRVAENTTHLDVLVLDDKPEDVLKLLKPLRILFSPLSLRTWYVEWEEKTLKSWIENTISGDRPEFPWDAVKSDAESSQQCHPIPQSLLDFHYILLDLEYDGKNQTADLTRHLNHLLASSKADPGKASSLSLPLIIALTRSANPNDIHQCMNHGVSAYVYKDRSYLLAREIMRTYCRNEPSARIGARDERSNYRCLYKLPPSWERVLRRTLVADGGKDASPQEFLLRNARSIRNRRFVEELPKADLHVHIGTSISPTAIEVMAINTVSYLIRANRGEEWTPVMNCVKRCAAAILLANHWMEKHDEMPHEAEVLQAAAEALFGRPTRVENSATPPLIRAIEAIRGDDETPIASFQVQSLLVALVGLFGNAGRQDSQELLIRRWGHDLGSHNTAARGKLARFVTTSVVPRWRNSDTCEPLRDCWGPLVEGESDDGWADFYMQLKDKLCETRAELQEAADETKSRWVNNLNAGAPVDPEGRQRIAELQNAMGEIIRDSQGWTISSSADKDRLSLSGLIEVSEDDDAPRSLVRYLWGADLLGAEHLQYPENILIAAWDLIDQARRDNIRYQELRCSPNGYTIGGMSAKHGIAVLRLALDTAAVAVGRASGRWCSTGLLITGKRHKSEQETRDLVCLTVAEREEPAIDSATERTDGNWWTSTHVVGFDLAGPESGYAAELIAPRIESIKRRCIPLTAHAGEAASAESIWQAVYRLGARRIGHGLRIRENKELIEYVKSEAVCLELCPQSNTLTNVFKAARSPSEYRGRETQNYPLLYYMQEELEVTLGTDNRFLHRDPTLSGEYLRAAHLVGGLPLWEVLKISKAGFKHAFQRLPVIQEMLLSMDAEVAIIVSRYCRMWNHDNRWGDA